MVEMEREMKMQQMGSEVSLYDHGMADGLD